jgi:hypothetical protein
MGIQLIFFIQQLGFHQRGALPNVDQIAFAFEQTRI